MNMSPNNKWSKASQARAERWASLSQEEKALAREQMKGWTMRENWRESEEMNFSASRPVKERVLRSS